MVRVYDRPLLRSSARGDGALKATNDRFAIGFTGTRMRASGFYANSVTADVALLQHLSIFIVVIN